MNTPKCFEEAVEQPCIENLFECCYTCNPARIAHAQAEPMQLRAMSPSRANQRELNCTAPDISHCHSGLSVSQTARYRPLTSPFLSSSLFCHCKTRDGGGQGVLMPEFAILCHHTSNIRSRITAHSRHPLGLLFCYRVTLCSSVGWLPLEHCTSNLYMT